eukprot:gnl/Chilomastix_cuspidata/3846.p1 GENE.gnl/Chilomastix_cuspidata/3846~~gnl/Chilomastix_cuspidata/3846.p1  ORF type:complete len:2789 (-),score=508.68 gnl/Chilomastix_cuspidata/3846:35-8401(-)
MHPQAPGGHQNTFRFAPFGQQILPSNSIIPASGYATPIASPYGASLQPATQVVYSGTVAPTIVPGQLSLAQFSSQPKKPLKNPRWIFVLLSSILLLLLACFTLLVVVVFVATGAPLTTQPSIHIGSVVLSKYEEVLIGTPSTRRDSAAPALLAGMEEDAPIFDFRVTDTSLSALVLLAVENALLSITFGGDADDVVVDATGFTAEALEAESVSIGNLLTGSLVVDDSSVAYSCDDIFFKGSLSFPSPLWISPSADTKESQIVSYYTPAAPPGIAAGGTAITSAAQETYGCRFDLSVEEVLTDSDPSLALRVGTKKSAAQSFPLSSDPFLTVGAARARVSKPLVVPSSLQVGRILFDGRNIAPSDRTSVLNVATDSLVAASPLAADTVTVSSNSGAFEISASGASGDDVSLVSSGASFLTTGGFAAGAFRLVEGGDGASISVDGDISVSFPTVEISVLASEAIAQLGALTFSGDSVSPFSGGAALACSSDQFRVTGSLRGLANGFFFKAYASDIRLDPSFFRVVGTSKTNSLPLLLSSGTGESVAFGSALSLSGTSPSLMVGDLSFGSGGTITASCPVLLRSSAGKVSFAASAGELGDIRIAESGIVSASEGNSPLTFDSEGQVALDTGMAVASVSLTGSVLVEDSTVAVQSASKVLNLNTDALTVTGSLTSSSGSSLVVNGGLSVTEGVMRAKSSNLVLSTSEENKVRFAPNADISLGSLKLDASNIASTSSLTFDFPEGSFVELEDGISLFISDYTLSSPGLELADALAPLTLGTPSFVACGVSLTGSSVQESAAGTVSLSSTATELPTIILSTSNVNIGMLSAGQLLLDSGLSLSDSGLSAPGSLALVSQGGTTAFYKSASVLGTQNIHIASSELREGLFSYANSLSLSAGGNMIISPLLTTSNSAGFSFDVQADTMATCSSGSIAFLSSSTFEGALSSACMSLTALANGGFEVSLLCSEYDAVAVSKVVDFSVGSVSFLESGLATEESEGVAQPLTISSPAQFAELNVGVAEFGDAAIGSFLFTATGVEGVGDSDIVFSFSPASLQMPMSLAVSGSLVLSQLEISSSSFVSQEALAVSSSLFPDGITFDDRAEISSLSLEFTGGSTTASTLICSGALAVGGDLSLSEGGLDLPASGIMLSQPLLFDNLLMSSSGVSNEDAAEILLGAENTLVFFGDSIVEFGGKIQFDEIGGIGQIYLHDGYIGAVETLVFNSGAARAIFTSQGAGQADIVIGREIIISEGLRLQAGSVSAERVGANSVSVLQLLSSGTQGAALQTANPLLQLKAASGGDCLFFFMDSTFAAAADDAQIAFVPPSGTLGLASDLVIAGNITLSPFLSSVEGSTPVSFGTFKVRTEAKEILFTASETTPLISSSTSSPLMVAGSPGTPVTLVPASLVCFQSFSTVSMFLSPSGEVVSPMQVSSASLTLSEGSMEFSGALMLSPTDGFSSALDCSSSLCALTAGDVRFSNTGEAHDVSSGTITFSSPVAISASASAVELFEGLLIGLALDSAPVDHVTIHSALAAPGGNAGMLFEPAVSVEALSDVFLSSLRLSAQDGRFTASAGAAASIPPISAGAFSIGSTQPFSSSKSGDALAFDTDVKLSSEPDTRVSKTNELTATSLVLGATALVSQQICSDGFSVVSGDGGVRILGTLTSDTGFYTGGTVFSSTSISAPNAGPIQLTGGSFGMSPQDSLLIGASSSLAEVSVVVPGGIELDVAVRVTASSFSVGSALEVNSDAEFSTSSNSISLNNLIFASGVAAGWSLASPYTSLVVASPFTLVGMLDVSNTNIDADFGGFSDIGAIGGAVLDGGGFHPDGSGGEPTAFAVVSDTFVAPRLISYGKTLLEAGTSGRILLGEISTYAQMLIGPKAISCELRSKEEDETLSFLAGGLCLTDGDMKTCSSDTGVFAFAFAANVLEEDRAVSVSQRLQASAAQTPSVSFSGGLSFQTSTDILTPNVLSVQDTSGAESFALSSAGIEASASAGLGPLVFSSTVLTLEQPMTLGSKLVLSGGAVTVPSDLALAAIGQLSVVATELIGAGGSLFSWASSGEIFFGNLDTAAPYGGFAGVDAAQLSTFSLSDGLTQRKALSLALSSSTPVLSEEFDALCFLDCSSLMFRSDSGSATLLVNEFSLEVSTDSLDVSTPLAADFTFDASDLSLELELLAATVSGGLMFPSGAAINEGGISRMKLDFGANNLLLGTSAAPDTLELQMGLANSLRINGGELSSASVPIELCGLVVKEEGSVFTLWGPSVSMEFDFGELMFDTPSGASVAFTGEVSADSIEVVADEINLGSVSFVSAGIDCSGASTQCYDVTELAAISFESANAQTVGVFTDEEAVSAAAEFAPSGDSFEVTIGGDFSTTYVQSIELPMQLDIESASIKFQGDSMSSSYELMTFSVSEVLNFNVLASDTFIGLVYLDEGHAFSASDLQLEGGVLFDNLATSIDSTERTLLSFSKAFTVDPDEFFETVSFGPALSVTGALPLVVEGGLAASSLSLGDGSPVLVTAPLNGMTEVAAASSGLFMAACSADSVTNYQDTSELVLSASTALQIGSAAIDTVTLSGGLSASSVEISGAVLDSAAAALLSVGGSGTSATFSAFHTSLVLGSASGALAVQYEGNCLSADTSGLSAWTMDTLSSVATAGLAVHGVEVFSASPRTDAITTAACTSNGAIDLHFAPGGTSSGCVIAFDPVALASYVFKLELLDAGSEVVQVASFGALIHASPAACSDANLAWVALASDNGAGTVSSVSVENCASQLHVRLDAPAAAAVAVRAAWFKNVDLSDLLV